MLLIPRTAYPDDDLVTGQPVFEFSGQWDYLDGSVVLEPDWAAHLPAIRSEEDGWLHGSAPFVMRSLAAQEIIEQSIRQLPRRLRRQRLRQMNDFLGTRLFYDSEGFPILEGADENYEAGPNTLYFAKNFSVDSRSDVVSVLLEVQFSAGFVAYLNGREWIRHNVNLTTDPYQPADIVWQPDWVLQAVGGVWQRDYLDLSTEFLHEGENILTFEVHRRPSGGSHALYFDARLLSFDRIGFIRTPYLQQVSTDSITVMWQTNLASLGYVEYGCSDLLDRVGTSPEVATTLHEVTLTGLEPDTRYFYRVHSLYAGWDAEATQSSPIYHFRTAAPRGVPFDFLAYGDNRTFSDAHARLIELMGQQAAQHEVGFVINTGDLTTSGASWSEWYEEFFEPALPLMAYVPFFAVLGNHEYNHESYYENLSLPNNEAWYGFSYGDVDFFALNTSTDFSLGSEQYRWFENALATSRAPWKIAIFHYPAFSCVPARKPGNEQVLTVLVPLLERYGVDLVLSGHDHVYGRSVPINGVTYVITGGGGAPTYPAQPDEINELCIRERHFLHFRVAEDALAFDAISIEGEIMDSVTLTR